ncbi:hypothetical protein Pst134EA_009807 [Puccinia striiformis f. sp. tritici]|nr:hypothetical protein Pst134EA_009807 [Puccinia striiformis f. sp. tritici]KAH9469286.1 hypothetical protein Pst134EA_009807 [Puccinia striiformis f. sp. tritici]
MPSRPYTQTSSRYIDCHPSPSTTSLHNTSDNRHPDVKPEVLLATPATPTSIIYNDVGSSATRPDYQFPSFGRPTSLDLRLNANPETNPPTIVTCQERPGSSPSTSKAELLPASTTSFNKKSGSIITLLRPPLTSTPSLTPQHENLAQDSTTTHSTPSALSNSASTTTSPSQPVSP